ncbi:hypothetical protein [Neorhizobium sp. DAR64860/K0K1]|uniref:hypothetical protein n=1 Tax=Neorhizobium sp. DAR64860/K0K1 TaxID=3421955 RepID=UPI003D28694C
MIAPYMQAIELALKLTIVEQHEPNETICFFERVLASVVAITTEDEMVEVGHISSEGATGLHTGGTKRSRSARLFALRQVRFLTKPDARAHKVDNSRTAAKRVVTMLMPNILLLEDEALPWMSNERLRMRKSDKRQVLHPAQERLVS